MRKLLTAIALFIFGVSITNALEPVRVAIIKTDGTAPFSVTVELNDYTGGTPTNILPSTSVGSLTPNSSGVMSFVIEGAAWTGIPASNVNSYYLVDVKVGGTLYAQYRLDELMILQAQTGNGSAMADGAGAFKSNTGTITAVTGGDDLDMEGNNILNVDSLSGNSGVLKTNSFIYQNLGSDNTAFGDKAALNNTGFSVTATGYEAANNNSGNSVTAIGNDAGTNNTGSLVVAVGSGSAYDNTNNGLTAIGYKAARTNSGLYVTASGYGSAYQNTGNYLTSSGVNSAHSNSGSFVTTIGYDAGNGNTKNDLTALGFSSGYGNSGDKVTSSGVNSAFQNTGNNLTANGYTSAYQNSGNNVTANGYYSALQNTGSNVTASGVNSAIYNSGSNVLALGNNAGFDGTDGNTISNVTILPSSVLTAYADKTAADTAFGAMTLVSGNYYLYYNQALGTIGAYLAP